MAEPTPDGSAVGRTGAHGVRAHPNYRVPASLPIELRRPGVPTHVREWAGRMLGAPVVGVRRMPGASSTAVHLLRLANGRTVVLRRYVWPGFLEAEPIAVEREVDVLAFAAGHGLPVPEVLASDLTGAEIGDHVPAVLMERLPGSPVADPDLHRLAEAAARVHDVDPSGLGHEYFRWFPDTDLAPPPGARDRGLWEWALSVRAQALPPHQPVLIHRDFHPGNVLWFRGRVSGIVDWANGCRGPAGCDVATCRRNLMALHGPGAADDFLTAYVAVTGHEPHPHWEVLSVLEHGPGTWTSEEIDIAEHRLDRARQELGD